MKGYIGSFVFAALLVACTPPRHLPNEDQYNEDTSLMINVCTKLADDPDVKRVHKAAVSIQQARVVSCSDYFGECNKYGKYLTLVIDSAADGSYTTDERKELRAKLTDLKKTIQEGRKELRLALKNHPSK